MPPYRYHFFKGRVALYAILKAMGIGPGDEVILPGFTCFVVPNAIIYLGASPVYVDIDPTTYNIDYRLIEEKISGRTRAIIVQHTFGIPAEMDEIIRIARQHELFVIEDSCHAMGSQYKGREVGTFGDAAFFSSQWSKPVTTGLGGWAVVNNESLQEGMRKIYQEFTFPFLKESLLLEIQYFAYQTLFSPSTFWFMQETYRWLSRAGILIGSSSQEEFEQQMPTNYKKRMSLWQQSLLEKILLKIEKAVQHRKKVASLYGEILKSRGLNMVELPEHHDPVFLRYPILVTDKRQTLEEARRQRIELGDWFVSPVHDRLQGWDGLGYIRGMCPNAEKACEQIVNLPTHEGIGDAEVKQSVDVIERWMI